MTRWLIAGYALLGLAAAVLGAIAAALGRIDDAYCIPCFDEYDEPAALPQP